MSPALVKQYLDISGGDSSYYRQQLMLGSPRNMAFHNALSDDDQDCLFYTNLRTCQTDDPDAIQKAIDFLLCVDVER